MSFTAEVKDFARKIGLDVVRVTSAEPFGDASQRIKEQIQRGLIPGAKIEDVDAFCNPRSVLPAAKSILVVAECYLTSEPEDLTRPGEPHGRIARYTWRNYYYDVKMKLKKVAAFLRKRVGTNFRFRCYSNGKLAEKPMAQRSGIGWYGKNGVILNEKYGSWIVLGELITNVELKVDEPSQRSCGNCRACIKSCPTGTIIEPYILDRQKCLQYITAKLQVMPTYIREIWGNRLYGCTTCQDVCPLNHQVKPKNRRPKYGHIGSSIPLIPILQMNKREFRNYFRHNQIGEWWVPVNAIKRNAVVALGNIGDSVAIPSLVRILKNSKSKVVRRHATWALGKIDGYEAKTALQSILKKESDTEVQKEIDNALKMLKGVQ